MVRPLLRAHTEGPAHAQLSRGRWPRRVVRGRGRQWEPGFSKGIRAPANGGSWAGRGTDRPRPGRAEKVTGYTRHPSQTGKAGAWTAGYRARGIPRRGGVQCLPAPTPAMRVSASPAVCAPRPPGDPRGEAPPHPLGPRSAAAPWDPAHPGAEVLTPAGPQALPSHAAPSWNLCSAVPLPEAPSALHPPGCPPGPAADHFCQGAHLDYGSRAEPAQVCMVLVRASLCCVFCTQTHLCGLIQPQALPAKVTGLSGSASTLRL